MKKTLQTKYTDDYKIFKRLLLNYMKEEINLNPNNRNHIATQYFFYFHRLEVLIILSYSKNREMQYSYDIVRSQIMNRTDLKDIDKVLYIITVAYLLLNDEVPIDDLSSLEEKIILNLDEDIISTLKNN